MTLTEAIITLTFSALSTFVTCMLVSRQHRLREKDIAWRSYQEGLMQGRQMAQSERARGAR